MSTHPLPPHFVFDDLERDIWRMENIRDVQMVLLQVLQIIRDMKDD
jgi:hypothetical protein